MNNNDHFHGDNSKLNTNIQRESVLNDDIDVQLEIEEIIANVDPDYYQNYPSLTKWTKDHPKTQVIGDTFFWGLNSC